MSKTILIPYPKPSLDGSRKIGGKTVFLNHFEQYAKTQGNSVTWSKLKADSEVDVVLLSPGTRDLTGLIRLSRKTKIIQRLDRWHSGEDFGSNIYKKTKNWASTLQTNYIRKHIADVVIYQSESVKQKWYDSWGGKASGHEVVIYNGTDTNMFYPTICKKISKPIRILFVEGDYYDNKVTNDLLRHLSENFNDIKISLVGNIPASLKDKHASNMIDFKGLVPHEKMPEVFRQHDIYISIEKDAPCPNAVIEAMSSGLPILGFNWGAMPEIVTTNSGILIKTSQEGFLSKKELSEIVNALNEIVNNYSFYSNNARESALKNFDINIQAEKYLDYINQLND